MARKQPRRRRDDRTRPSRRPVRRYDMGMIQDFLEHLLWAARVSHFESTSPPDTVHPELAEQLARYLGRYGAVLLPVVYVQDANPSGGSEPAVRAKMARVRQAQIDALEMLLGGVLVDARHCVEQSYDA